MNPDPGLEDLLLFAFEYPPCYGGISRLCGEIARGFALSHVNVRILTQRFETNCFDSPLQEIRVTAHRPGREWRAFRWLSNQPVRSSTICSLWYPEGLIAYLAGVRPFIILAHGAELLPTTNRWLRPLWNAMQRMVLEAASLVIANSDYTGQLVSKVAPNARVESIPLAVDPKRFAPKDQKAAKNKFGVSGKQVLCTVSRVYAYKGHDVVLRALATLAPKERERIVYLVAGTGPYEPELRKLATNLGVESNVRWLGFVAEDELPEVYSASDLFVLCTRDSPEERSVEGFGLVFLEAQACGTPVVGTRTGGIAAAIHDGEGGWLIDQDDCLRLAEIIRQLLHSPESFRSVGRLARRRVTREHKWDDYIRHLSVLLQGVGVRHE